MSTVAGARAADEELAFVHVGSEDVFTVLTRPPAIANRVAVVILTGGGRRGQGGTPCFGRNRSSVSMARSLAADGYHVVRLDYPGVGESSGGPVRIDLRTPFVAETVAISRWVLGSGEVDRVVLCGGCFGGRAALAAAAELPEAAGAVLWGSPVLDYEWGARVKALPTGRMARKALGRRAVAGWRNPRRRKLYLALIRTRVQRLLRLGRGHRNERVAASGAASPLVQQQVRCLVERQVPTVFLFGDDDGFRADFERARMGAFADLVDRSGELVAVEVVEGKVHGLTTVAAQRAAEAATRRLLDRLA